MESKVRPNGFDRSGYDRNVSSSEINRKEAVFGTDKLLLYYNIIKSYLAYQLYVLYL